MESKFYLINFNKSSATPLLLAQLLPTNTYSIAKWHQHKTKLSLPKMNDTKLLSFKDGLFWDTLYNTTYN